MEKKRLLSLDILRGMTVAGMIFVNNQGGERFPMLEHAEWNGLTPCDLVFPFFLFMVGVSTYLSLSKSQFKADGAVVWKIIRRTALLFLIGLGINLLATALWKGAECFAELRVFSVLGRIGLSYCGVALFAVFCNHKYLLHTVVGLLVAYGAILVLGNGYVEDPAVNILGRVDTAVVGASHVYRWAPIDPEGLLGVISGVAHAMMGFYCGKLIKQGETINQKLIALFVTGTVLMFAGFLLSYGLPLNKNVWSPSFALVTCGFASLMLALMAYVIDVKKSTRWTTFFHTFGVNALVCYALSECLGVILDHVGVTGFVYDTIHAAIPMEQWASVVYAAVFVTFIFALSYPLYKKGIYIKL